MDIKDIATDQMTILAEKVRDGQATDVEKKEFFKKLNVLLKDLDTQLDTADKTISN